jgi:lipoate-protein ligase A
MALDEALMESARRGLATLRFYEWRPGCLSFGRNQIARERYDRAEAKRLGIDIVRRPTGGRAVYHDRELTYSLTAPADAWGSMKEAYTRINRALSAGLRRLGVPASVAAHDQGRPSPRPTVRACFRDPLPGEVMADGCKLVGSAQWRKKGALLQHGSILVHNDQAVVEQLCSQLPSEPADVPAASLSDLLPAVPCAATVARTLAGGFEDEFGLPLRLEVPTRSERALAARLMDRHTDNSWIWRR